ncbi:pyrimidine-nucleoside phosphorylase [Massilibacterium senegalense]|uniref:pyrimidine-nucleoside phosphorylase n=1 Tax=Massilibacterium senegalense TaxID=1632858 RepID=UPI000785FF31|nr:pyrimidine-nucleoside phosphorylase [Massilibacterium senegalense]
MRMIEWIEKKRNGFSLTKQEIEQMIQAYTAGVVPDYQMSAFLMAVYFKGMTVEESAYLTMAMAQSGDQMDLSPIDGIKVDKHSTGGVGDKVSLVLGPLVASCGGKVAKMSGRGLGHTGGTIDKLESFPGFQVAIPKETFFDLVNTHGISIIGQSAQLTPADKKMYALRDVTATVDSIPLIASSIMSKKIAAGADAIVLDVKCGNGAFMKTQQEAAALAELMVNIGGRVGRQTIAVISNMAEPLGHAVGNILEVKEAIATLNGEGPADVLELCLTLGSYMLLLSKKAATIEEARAQLQTAIVSGKALEKFRTFVLNQGGDKTYIDHPEKWGDTKFQVDIQASFTGYIEQIDAHAIGIAAMKLGAGRATKESTIDHQVGIIIHKKIGDEVHPYTVIATIYVNNESYKESVQLVKDAFSYSTSIVEKPTVLLQVIQ